jgi:hypothetical protein
MSIGWWMVISVLFGQVLGGGSVLYFTYWWMPKHMPQTFCRFMGGHYRDRDGVCIHCFKFERKA